MSYGFNGFTTFLCSECTADGPRIQVVPSKPEEKKNTTTFFDLWASKNDIIGPDRSRFDWLRENLPQARSAQEATAMIRQEEFLSRYPIIPEWNW